MVHYRSEVSCKKKKKKKTGVPQAPYSPASLIKHFPVSMNESLFKVCGGASRGCRPNSFKSCMELWGKNEILNGIVLIQKWAYLEGIMFNKIYVLYVTFYLISPRTF
jgi:hypothetical protein